MYHKYKVSVVARWWKSSIWFGNQLVRKSLPYLWPFFTITHPQPLPIKVLMHRAIILTPTQSICHKRQKNENRKIWNHISVWFAYFLLQNRGQGGGCKWRMEIKSFGKYAQGLTSLIGCLFYICLNQIYWDQVYRIYIDNYIEIYWQIYWGQKPRVSPPW